MRKIEGEGGTFFVSDDGVLEKFVPASGKETDGYYCLERLIIPEGVVKIGTRVLDCLKVTGEFRFPQSLRMIGTEMWECGISWCKLPDVVIPEGVQEITSFGFGHSELRSLRIPAGVKFVGGRHLKGTHIGTLYVPRSLEELVEHTWKGNNLTCDEIVWSDD